MEPTDSEERAHRDLVKDKHPNIDKMLKDELKEECQMWRNIWSWVPSAVKFYASKTGTLVGLQVRNYHRFVGILLDTHWELKAVECGVYEKVYDQNDGQYYMERKVIRIPQNQLVSFDWISERKPVEDYVDEPEAEPEQ